MIQPRQELPTNVVHYYRKIKTSLLLNILLCLSWTPHWWWLPPVVSGVALMWSLQTDEYKLHSGARLQAGKRQAKTKEQFVAQVGGWRCSRHQGQQIPAAGLPWPHLCPQMRCTHKHSTDETTRLYEAGWLIRGIMRKWMWSIRIRYTKQISRYVKLYN